MDSLENWRSADRTSRISWLGYGEIWVATIRGLPEEDAVNRNSFGSKLLDLQRRQFQHDEISHSDILTLLLPRRLTHFTLHFAKYLGRLPRAFSDPDALEIRRLAVDTLIIALAAANSMNLNLTERFARYGAVLRTRSAARKPGEARLAIQVEFAEIVGNMAKACEVLDHLENYPSREILEQSTADIVDLCFRIAEQEQIEIIPAVIERWAQVEAKSVLKRAEPDIAAARSSSISAVA